MKIGDPCLGACGMVDRLYHKVNISDSMLNDRREEVTGSCSTHGYPEARHQNHQENQALLLYKRRILYYSIAKLLSNRIFFFYYCSLFNTYFVVLIKIFYQLSNEKKIFPIISLLLSLKHIISPFQ
jgi:hypothetical protein